MITSDSAALRARPAPPWRCTRWLAVGSLLALIVLGLAWELWLAPLRPGGSGWSLKVLPLCVPLAGLLRNRMYTYRWVSLMVWLYFTEGVVRAYSDRGSSARAGAARGRCCAWRCSPPACCTCGCRLAQEAE